MNGSASEARDAAGGGSGLGKGGPDQDLGAPAAGTARRILEMISSDAFAEELQTSELLEKVRETVTEVSASRWARIPVRSPPDRPRLSLTSEFSLSSDNSDHAGSRGSGLG